MHKEKVKEIFSSIQGEGPFIGYKQVFVRFCECNLKCKYCDTSFSLNNTKEYTDEELAQIINNEKNCHSVAITGGEPLLHSVFLKELFNKLNKPIYLETNATLYKELETIIDKVSIVSADIKLKSASGMDTFKLHEKFFEICKKNKKTTFAKVVFDNNIIDKEIKAVVELAQKFDIEIILQPVMHENSFTQNATDIEETFNKFTTLYKKTRLIPQTHKFLGIK